MTLTESQRAAIDHRGSSLLVSASAGSGKTEVLARRCVSLIADPRSPCDVGRLLVVTFTRAAAAELRLRIARMLREEAGRAPDAAWRGHLRRQEILVDAADIGTIDAWCGRIVRAHHAESGVDPAFATLSEEDAHLLRRQVLDDLFAWVYRSGEALAAAARDWIARHDRPSDDFLRNMILRLSAFREHLVEVSDWLAQQRERCAASDDALRIEAREVLAGALAEECRFQLIQTKELLAGGADPQLAQGLAPVQTALSDWSTRLVEQRGEALLPVVGEIDALRVRKPRGLDGLADRLFREVHERWLKGRLKKRWRPPEVENMVASAPAAARLTGLLLDLEQRYQERLWAAKRTRGAYEFADVLRLALDLLGTPRPGGRTPTEIALHLRQRYEHILVDEYQDTSPVQAEILRLVARDEAGSSNRFLVGDVKQSIYGFRQADPRLMVAQIADFESGRQEGNVRYLADNFRSHGDLLGGLNRMFAMLLHRELGGTTFEERERLQACREEIANPTIDSQPRIELHLFTKPDEDEGEPADEGEQNGEAIPLERIEREALVAAQRIRQMLSAGEQVPERGPDGMPRLRPLRRSDIVILLRSARQNAAAVAGVLREQGIPCLTGGREALFDVPEVMDLRNVLALLVNRRQDVPLAAYLRSPMVGLSSQDLLRIRGAAPTGSFHDAVSRFCGWTDEPEARSSADSVAADDTAAVVRAALSRLDRWSVQAREQELPELLRCILQDTGLTMFAAALPGGAHRVGMLRAIETFAAAFARSGQHGVGEFMAYLDDLATAELEPGLPVAAGEDAVRVMTIHAAKGLEFPVVFLLNTGGRFNRARLRDPLQCDEELGVGLRFYDYPARAAVIGAHAHLAKYQLQRRELEEEMRLLYVATTRARERLLIVGHAPPEVWEPEGARCTAPPPLASRLSVASALEWVLLGVTGSRLHELRGKNALLVSVTVHDASRFGDVARSSDSGGRASPAEAWTNEDESWLRRGGALLAAAPDTALAAFPAVLSVSALKDVAAREQSADVSRPLVQGPAGLRAPVFATGREEEGREAGLAYHRFLELADLSCLRSELEVGRQIEALVRDGRLTAAEAARLNVADLGWLARSAVGDLLAARASTARRELAFVYALPIGSASEAVVVRGVIDCVVETSAGLVVLDYKTDRVADAAELAARVARYTTQLQVYALAASQILDRPAARAVLVFLAMRRLVEVSCDPATLRELPAAVVAGISQW